VLKVDGRFGADAPSASEAGREPRGGAEGSGSPPRTFRRRAMREYVNYYFKDQDPTKPLISGMPLPKDHDGVVREVRFIDCDFHPNCQDVKFERCEFVRCQV
jgi:hypothetical protein